MRPVRSFALAARLATALAFAALVAGTFGASVASADSGLTNPKHFFWAGVTPPSPDALTNDII